MTNLLRATLRPRAVRPVLLATAGTALLCAGVVIGMTSRSQILLTPPPVVVLPAQVNVAPAPVLLPPTPVVADAPASSPPAAPPIPAPPPNLRARVPMLDAGCVLPTDDGPRATCAWDDGFPAISGDGTLVAIKYQPGVGASGNYGLSIRFIDTTTSRVVREREILTPDEQGTVLYPDQAASDDKQLQQRQRVRATIARRVAALQRTFEAKHFRSLRALGWARSGGSMGAPAPSQRGPDPIYAEIVDTTARIIDSTASEVLWRGDFWIEGPQRADDEHSSCPAWSLQSFALSWDPETRHVLAEQTYRTGGCMCDDVNVETVRRMP